MSVKKPSPKFWYDKAQGESLWWPICWIMFVVVFSLLCFGCAHASPEVDYEGKAAPAVEFEGLHIIDLGGRPIDVHEVIIFLNAFSTMWAQEGLGKLTSIRSSLKSNPMQAFVAPSETFQCTHTFDDSEHPRCYGAHIPNSTTMFINRVDGQNIGCGSLGHELAHEMLWRFHGVQDGTHNLVPRVWSIGGFLGKLKFVLGCVPGEGSLREWK